MADESNSTPANDPAPTPSLPPEPSGLGPLPAIALGALVLAVVAFVVLRSMTAAPPEQPTRAEDEEIAPVAVQLNLFVERDGQATPLAPGTGVAVGDRVLFELSSVEPTSTRLWIEEDGVTLKDLGNVETDTAPVMVGGEGGLLAWGFGAARTVTVRASAAARGCPATSCASQVVVAR